MYKIREFSERVNKYLIKKIIPRYSLLLPERKLRGKRVEFFHSFVTSSVYPNDYWLKKLYLKKIFLELSSLIKKKAPRTELRRWLVDIEYKKLNAGEWEELGAYVLSFGYFKAALECRQKAGLAINNLSHRLIYLFLYKKIAVRWLIEFEDWGQINYFNECEDSKNKIARLVLKGEIPDDNNDKFSAIINEKKIGVIGPLDISLSDREEMLECDCIVLLNTFICPDFLRSKTKILYLSGAVFEEIIDNNNICKTVDFDFLVTRETIAIHKYKGNIPVRFRETSHDITWNGALNFLQNVIFDLLLFNPFELRVFGADLFLSMNYTQNYVRSKHKIEKYYKQSFTNHDLITQYKCTQKLQQRNWISTTGELNRVLNEDVDYYLSEMENRYPLFLEL